MLKTNLYASEFTATNKLDDIVIYELAKEIKKLKEKGEIYAITSSNRTITILWDYKAHKNNVKAKIRKLMNEIKAKEEKKWK